MTTIKKNEHSGRYEIPAAKVSRLTKVDDPVVYSTCIAKCGLSQNKEFYIVNTRDYSIAVKIIVVIMKWKNGREES